MKRRDVHGRGHRHGRQLWQFFEQHGVDVQTMTPSPMAGPQPVEAPPEPSPPRPETEGEGETNTLTHRASETLAKVQESLQAFIRRSPA
jgi:hypothetical protein